MKNKEKRQNQMFEKIGKVVIEGEKRGFKKQEILQLIIARIIKV